jgi:hypothetical protein
VTVFNGCGVPPPRTPPVLAATYSISSTAIDALDTGKRGGPEPDAITLATFGREIPEA